MIHLLNTKSSVNTSDSYNKDIFTYRNNLIIPYVNLQIFDINFVHPKIKKYDKLDFSYLIFKEVKEISWKCEVNGKTKYKILPFDDISNINNEYSTEYIDATSVFVEHYGYNFEIKFNIKYLCFSDEVNMKNGGLGLWIPVDTPNFRKNLNEEKVQNFFSKEYIPKEILELIGASDFSMLEILKVL